MSEQILLATLSAGKADGPIKIDTELVNPRATVYDCISYDRSKDYGSEDVTVNGDAIQIPKPLAEAMRSVRTEERPRKVWANLLLGSSDEERSRQAGQLCETISNSSTLLVWLGTSGLTEHEQIEVLNLAQNLADHYKQAQQETGLPESLSRTTAQQLGRTQDILLAKQTERPTSTELWDRLQTLFYNDYFGTVHAIPELLLAPEIRFIVGPGTISWIDFLYSLRAMLYLMHPLQITPHPNFMKSFARIESLAIAIRRKNAGESLELMPMIGGARNTEYGDPREIVFSQLPIVTPCARTARDTDRPTQPTADYTATIAQVYKDAAKYILLDRQDLMLWAFERPPCGRRVLDLPTWVPDWSAGKATEAMMLNDRSGLRLWADPLTRKRIRVDDDFRLHIEATALDRVVYVSEILTEANCRRLCLTQWTSAPVPANTNVIQEGDKIWRTLILDYAGHGNTVRDIVKAPPEFLGCFQSLLAEEMITKDLDCDTMDQVHADPLKLERTRTEAKLIDLMRGVGYSEPYVERLKENSLGRRFFRTANGRYGMTAVETTASPLPTTSSTTPESTIPSNTTAADATATPANPPVPNFAEIMHNPLAASMLSAFLTHVDGQNPRAAQAVRDAMDGRLPRQQAPGVRVGDIIVAAVGGYAPYILSEVGKVWDGGMGGLSGETGGVTGLLDAEKEYRYVGDCYLHGCMDGEPLKAGRAWFGVGAVRWRGDLEVVDVTIV